MTASLTPDQAADLADQAAPLDALLIDAALGTARRFAPDLSTAKLALGLARRPRVTLRRVGSLGAEVGRIAIGTSTLAPSKRDRRFLDEAWTDNPLLRRLVQVYLAGGQTAEQLLDDAELEWRDEQRVRLLADAGGVTVMGVPIDLSRVDTDAYVVAGIADHITPWQNCYRTTQLLGGTTRFVLSTSGHIAALVNPPGNPKASFQVNKATPADPAEWLQNADTTRGTWWTDASAWLAERSGAAKPAPEHLGGGGLRPLVDAPGTYIFDS